MINFICGEIVDIQENTIVIKCRDIGYELFVTNNTIESCTIGQSVQMFTQMQVMSNQSSVDIMLFGFSTQTEKAMFSLLKSVSGIGGKKAITILNSTDCNSLALDLYNGNVAQLSKLKGIGKKTAEMLILHLREKVTAVTMPVGVKTIKEEVAVYDTEMQNAISVLMSLGLASADAERKVVDAKSNGASTTEELINMAFKLS